MKRTLLTLLALAFGATLSAAQVIVPVAGAGAGANGSQWQSEITIHNVAFTAASLSLSFHDATGPLATHQLTVPAGATVTLPDIVVSTFGIIPDGNTVTGAVVIESDEITLLKVAVSSRTFNSSESGEFGQDIPALRAAESTKAAETAVLTGPSETSGSRFNFGLYALEESEVQWVLVRASGEVAATVDRKYDGGIQVQYNGGIHNLLEVEPAPNDVIYARVFSGSILPYGSIVNNGTNDPSFVTAFRTRENFQAQLLGVDLNEDGEIDIFDANGDGILDAPVPVRASHGFPSYFRIIAADPEGQQVRLTLIDAPTDVRLFDDGITVRWFPAGSLSGTTGALSVSANDGFAETRFLIPVTFH